MELYISDAQNSSIMRHALNQTQLAVIQCKDMRKTKMLCQDDWDNFESLANFLELFLQATEQCTMDKGQSLSKVVPWYNLLMDHCEKVKKSTTEEDDLWDAAEAAFEKLKQYYDCSSEHMTIAVLQNVVLLSGRV